MFRLLKVSREWLVHQGSLVEFLGWREVFQEFCLVHLVSVIEPLELQAMLKEYLAFMRLSLLAMLD